MSEKSIIINVDSSKRQKHDVLVPGSKMKLPLDPIVFRNNSRQVFVKSPSHSVNIGDTIRLIGMPKRRIILDNIISVKKNSKYIRIFHANHGISFRHIIDFQNPDIFEEIEYVDILPNSFKDDQDIPDTVNTYYVLKKNPNKYHLTLSITGMKNEKIGNISPDNINSYHIVQLIFCKNGPNYISDPNSYLIELDNAATVNYKDGYNGANNRLEIIFGHVHGIERDIFDNPASYFYVSKIDDRGVFIDLDKAAIVANVDNAEYSSVGGKNMSMQKITSVVHGFPDPSRYTIQLPSTLTNIVSGHIISSVFPNSHNSINSTNNKLFWRNISDKNIIYEIHVDHGTYSPDSIAKNISDKMANVSRLDGSKHDVEVFIEPSSSIVKFSSFSRANIDNQGISFLTDNFLITADELPDDKLVLIDDELSGGLDESYVINDNEGTINRKISLILDFAPTTAKAKVVQKSYNVSKNISSANFFVRNGNIRIPNHMQDETFTTYLLSDRINSGDGPEIFVINYVDDSTISIRESSSSDKLSVIYDSYLYSADRARNMPLTYRIILPKISKMIINKKHGLSKNDKILVDNISGEIYELLVDQVIDDSKYTVAFQNYFNGEPDISSTLTVKYPVKMQLLFDRAGTIGTALGFRDVGNKNSITPYATVISNTDRYITDPPRNHGFKYVPKLRLHISDYFYVCIEKFRNIHNTAPVESATSLIKWDLNAPKTIDGHVNIANNLDNMVYDISELDISIRDSENMYVDFNGLDHSFLLEIKYIDNKIAN